MDTAGETTSFELLETNALLHDLRRSLNELMMNDQMDEDTINFLCKEKIDEVLSLSTVPREVTDALEELQSTFTGALLNTITSVSTNQSASEQSASEHKASLVKTAARMFFNKPITPINKSHPSQSHPSIQRDKDDDEGNIHIDDMRL